MSRRLILAAAVAVTVASARPAAADGFYFLMGLGPSRYHDHLSQQLGEGGVHIRAAVGRRWANFGLELWSQGEIPFAASGAYDREGVAPTGGLGPYATPGMYGLDFKVIQPLSTHWSAYVRAGLSRMIVSENEYSGRGVGATAGIQVAGKVPALGYLWWPLFFLCKNIGPKVHSALWLEASQSFHRLHGRGPSIDARITGWTLGFSVGQDF